MRENFSLREDACAKLERMKQLPDRELLIAIAITLEHVKERLSDCVTQDEFRPVRNVAYGLIVILGTIVAGLIFRQSQM